MAYNFRIFCRLIHLIGNDLTKTITKRYYNCVLAGVSEYKHPGLGVSEYIDDREPFHEKRGFCYSTD